MKKIGFNEISQKIFNKKMTEFKLSLVELSDKLYLKEDTSLHEIPIYKLHSFFQNREFARTRKEELPHVKKVRFLIYTLMECQKNEAVVKELNQMQEDYSCYTPILDVSELYQEYLLERINMLEAAIKRIILP